MSKYLLYYFSTLIIVIMHILSYKELSNSKNVNITFKRLVSVLILSILVMINSYFNASIYKPLISLGILLLIFFIVFRHDIHALLSYGIVSYVLMMINEIIISVIFVVFKWNNFDVFNTNILLKTLLSIIILMLTIYECKIHFIRNISLKLGNIIGNHSFIITILFYLICIPIILEFRYVNNISILNYVLNIIFIIIFFNILIISVYYEIKFKNENKKYENLLDTVTQYEKIIDEYRINKHELQNNLLILRSYKHSSKEYNDLLDEMIDKYSKKDFSIKNMSKIPSGLKGILYYKINSIDKKINYNINISKNISIKIDDKKEYINLCKIFSILIDNAIEACNESKNKKLLIDIYEEKDRYCFSICNSFNKSKIDIKKINELHYSSKGKNRGFGLFIAKKIESESKCIKFKQIIDNDLFISELYAYK